MLVGRYVPTMVIRGHNKDKHWFEDQCTSVFGLAGVSSSVARDRSRVNWEEFVRCQV